MAWLEQLKGDPLGWLLKSETPGVRYLALRDLLDRPKTDRELQLASREAHAKGPIASVLNGMDKTGFWIEPGPGYNPKYRSTVWAMILLSQLGGSIEADPRIEVACKYLLDNARADGGLFSMNGLPSGTIDCLAGNLAASLLDLGYDDKRLDTAIDWMARFVTGEGIAPSRDGHAPIRYYAGKCGPIFACGANNKLPCAWGAVKSNAGLWKITPGTSHSCHQACRPARRGFPFQCRSRRCWISLRLERKTKRELVEIWLPGFLRDRPAPTRRSIGDVGIR